MKPWQYAFIVLALFTLAGCRSDPAIAILERELRLKEDEIYRLRATLEDMQDVPASCRDRVETSPASESQETGTRRKPRSTGPNGAGLPRVDVELPSGPSGAMPDSLKAPAGSLPPGIPEVPKELQGPAAPTTKIGDEGPTLEARHKNRMIAQGGEPVAFLPSGDSRQVASIALNRMLTGGISADERAGDQGLLVVVEPRDSAGRPVDAPADMSIVVLDPALEGEAMRIARWEFTAEETASLFRRSGSSGGAIHLAMAWPDDPPKHNKLRLFVRYTTADGRKLQTDQMLEIALPGEKTARWEPAEPNPTGGPSLGPPAPSVSWRTSETPMTARVPEPPVRTSPPPGPTKPERPVWSPER